MPLPLSIGLGVLLAVILALSLNALYQVVRKPTELFFPVSGKLYKTPQETWREYGPLFRRYATHRIPAPLLAALAQVEGSGNPLVRTYWRWSWVLRPFELYRPASSAVGMYQITDGTFAEARHYCIHAHAVVREGAWDDWSACWFNALYTRVLPADAVELTSAYLDLKVAGILARSGNRPSERGAEAPPGRGGPSVRCRRGGRLRRSGLSLCRAAALRRARSTRLPEARR